MTKTKGGFTLIEVSLFLAITGLLFLGVTIGVQNSIFQQRYNDSVQNFAEFLRSAYAKTENVQGTNNGGNTSQAIYGKLITFGERGSFNDPDNNPENEIFMYDVIGEAKCEGSFDKTIDALKTCKAEVVKREGGKTKIIGLAESYKPKWSAAIQTTNKDRAELFKGAILIIRHPQSGTIYTLVMINNTVEVNNGGALGTLSRALEGENFSSSQVDFCVNPNGDMKGGVRADVRIERGARNSAGVEIMSDDKNDCMNKE